MLSAKRTGTSQCGGPARAFSGSQSEPKEFHVFDFDYLKSFSIHTGRDRKVPMSSPVSGPILHRFDPSAELSSM